MPGQSRRHLAVIFALFAAGYFLSYSLRSIGPMIAPDLTRELALDANRLGLLASVYFLTFAIAYQVSFGSVLVLQVLALLWFSGMSRRNT